MESPADLPGYHVFRPTDLDATGAPLPVVVWANGGCVRFDGVWQPLLRSWAAAGYFVVSIAAPPDGPTNPADVTSAADQALAIDWAEKQNSLPGGPFTNRLDLDRVVAAGNSCGGITTIALTASDSRVTAAFVLSGSGAFPGTPIEQVKALISKISVPVAYVVGGPQDIARNFARQEYEVFPARVPAYIASRAEGDHVTVSTNASILTDEVAGIGINWFDLTLYGSRFARHVLLHDPCRDCDPQMWSVDAKNLDCLESLRGNREPCARRR